MQKPLTQQFIRKSKNACKRFLPDINYLLEKKQIEKSWQAQQLLENLQQEDQGFYVFWTHDAYLTTHFVAQCVVAKTLQSLGHKVLMINCNGKLQRCTVMDGSNLPLEQTKRKRKHFCATCQRLAADYFGQYKLPFINLRQLISAEELEEIDTTISRHQGDFTDFKYDNIGFGNIAIGEVIRICKLSDAPTSDYHREYIKQHAQAAMVNYLAFAKLTKHIKIQRLTFFGDYANVLGPLTKALQLNIPITNLSLALVSNVQRNRITFMRALSTHDQFWRLEQWPKWQHYPLSKAQVTEVGEDIIFRLTQSGFTIFSPQKSQEAEKLFDQLGLDRNKKLLVAYTSSLDEYLATKYQYTGLGAEPIPTQRPFEDQIIWLQKLAEFVRTSRTYQLVIRVHPREATDSFNEVISQNLLNIQKAFNQPIDNVTIIWPKDKVSSYDLGELADIALTGWTSVSLELGRLAVPVIAAFPYCPYPKGKFVHWADDEAGYFKLIDTLVHQPPNRASVIEAFRWFALARFGHAIEVGDIAPNHDFTTLPPFKMPLNAKRIEAVMVQNIHAATLNMQSRQNQCSQQELVQLKTMLKKIIMVLLEKSGDTNWQLCTFCNLDAFNNHACQDNEVAVFEKNYHLQIKSSSWHHCRYSPMISRLFHILANWTEQPEEDLTQCNTVKDALCQAQDQV